MCSLVKNCLLAVPFFIGLSTAQATDDEDYHQHGSHAHGAANLNIALDANELLIELESPAANVFGFEHEPKTKAQQETVNRSKNLLNHARHVVALSGGDCQLTSSEVTLPFSEIHLHHDEHSETGRAHSDIYAYYTFNCLHGNKLKAIDVRLFDHFSGFETITVQWLLNNKQGAAALSASNHVLEIN